jgi:fructose-1,6-bisphosphatase I
MEKAFATLETHLAHWHAGDELRSQVAEVVLGIAAGAVAIAQRVRLGRLSGLEGTSDEALDEGGRGSLDGWAEARLIAGLEKAPVALVASESSERPRALCAGAPLAVAMSPLEGSSSIDTNVAMGTVFSVIPVAGAVSPEAVFLQPGHRQLAAGYIIYGPQCALALSLGSGTHVFTFDGDSFRLTHSHVAISRDSNEYAIDASNYRFWSESIRAYIDDCIAGSEGARGADVSMRWIASLVSECHRILVRGGVFLYPRDLRRGYERGRLRLVFEANPIAFLIENAGGKAIDGFTRVLDLTPSDAHQRTPLMFGSASEIDRIARYKANPSDIFERSPLFGQRGLLKV